MTVYAERLSTEFEEITSGIDGLLERVAAEGRDLTDEENAQIERDDARRAQLETAIEHYAARAERTSRVSQLRGRVPAVPQRTAVAGAPAADPAAELLREYPTPGHYAALAHRAWAKRDRDAIAELERVAELVNRDTAHQTTADNPGLIPRPIVAPVVDRLRSMRPFIQSVGVQAAPAPKFDRPKVTQHVDVDVQAAEKDPTASQVLKVEPVPVTLATYAGHLNISKQDIRWSQPSILGLVYESFGKVYARRTDRAACAKFVADVVQTQAVAAVDPAAIDEALGVAGGLIETADGDMGELNRIWLSRDVAVRLGSLRNAVTGTKVYNIPIVGGTSGDLDGIPVTIDPRFAAGTMIGGDESLVEYWEDLEGFLSVDEPDVLGQLVGYAGYGSLATIDPTGFVQFTVPAPAVAGP